MSILRMNMGQKSAAKQCAKAAFGLPLGTESQNSPPGSVQTEPAGDAPGTLLRATSRCSQPDGSNDPPGWTTDAADPEGLLQLQALDDKIHDLRQLTEEDPDQVWMRRFNVTVGVIIILNVIVIAIETDAVHDEGELEDKIAWIVIDSLFILVFVMEMVVRMYVERYEWLRSGWNWFDLSIILLAILDIWVISFAGQSADLYLLSVFRIVRLVRLVRLVKLVRLLHGLYVILMAFWHAMQTMSFLLAIMLFGLMVYAIFATNLIGRNSNLRDVRIAGDTVDDRFGTVYRSMYSLFELMTLEGWEQVARPIVEELPYLFIFIVSFIMIFTFGMLNMIVALVIEKTLHHTRMMSEHALQLERARMADELVRVKHLFVGSREAGPGKITFEEFENALHESEAIRYIFESMGISLNDVRELYTVLDWNDSGELSVKEFLEGLQKLQDGAVSPWDILATHAQVRTIKSDVLKLNEKVSRLAVSEDKFRAGLEERLSKQEKLLQDILSRLDART